MRDKRIADVPADDLLWTVLKNIKRSDPAFQLETQFLEVQQRRKRLQVFEGDGHGGIAKKSLFIHGSSGRYPWSNKDTYFPKSYELMWSMTRSVEDVQKYADDVKKIIEVTYKTICEQVVSSGVKNAFECSSFKLSQAMIHFVQPIRRLAYMDGRISDSFNLALFLASKSYEDLPSIYGGYNYRISDPLIDELLDEISRQVKNDNENFDPTETIATIKRQMDFLEQRGVYTYLPEAYAFLITGEDGEKRKKRLKKGLKGDRLVPCSREHPQKNWYTCSH